MGPKTHNEWVVCISIKYTTRASQVALWFSSERKNLSPFTKDFRGLDHEKVFDSFCRRSDTTYQTTNEQLTPIDVEQIHLYPQ